MVKMPKQSLVSKTSYFLSFCKMLNDIADTGEKNFDELAKEDLAYFLLVLSRCDDQENNSEVYFILKCLGIDSLADVDIDSYPEEKIFVKDAPKSLIILAKIDNLIKAKNMEDKIPNLCEMFIDVYESLGKELILVDDFIEDIELKTLNDYLDMIREFAFNNSERCSDISTRSFIEYEDVDPDHRNVVFLGEKIRIPDVIQLFHYKTLMENIAKNYSELNEFLTQQYDEAKKNDDKYGLYLEGRLFRKEGFQIHVATEDILTLLESCGERICPYGDSRSKYIEYSKGYQALKKLCGLLASEAKRLYIAKEQAIANGQSLARLRAASQITGMGYGIITNSAPDLLLYHAISRSTLKQQARRADAQYREEAGNSAKEAFSIYSNSLRKLFFNTFIPEAQKCIDFWINEATENAISYESTHELPLYNEIAQYNIQVSERIVQSINSQMEKEDIIKELRRAFRTCPFDFSIYEKAAELTVLDEESAKTAKLLGSYKLPDYVLQLCKDRITNIEFVKKQYELLKIIDSKHCDEKIQQLYTPIAESVKSKYSELISAKNSKDTMLTIIRSLPFCKRNFDFTCNTEETLTRYLQEHINKIVSEDMFSFLVEIGVLSPSELVPGSAEKLSQINEYVADSLIPVVIAYHQKMIEERRKWDMAMSEYNEKCTECKKEIDALTEELNQTIFLQFKKRSELKKMIDKKTEFYEDYRSNRKPTYSWI